MLSKALLDEMGLLTLKHKDNQQNAVTDPVQKTVEIVNDKAPSKPIMNSGNDTEKVSKSKLQPKLDKNEFRLLVKMLQAIGHECVYDNISYDGHSVTYQLPQKNLLFKDINLADDATTMNLSSLTDLINTPELKRPVWEKLKTI